MFTKARWKTAVVWSEVLVLYGLLNAQSHSPMVGRSARTDHNTSSNEQRSSMWRGTLPHLLTSWSLSNLPTGSAHTTMSVSAEVVKQDAHAGGRRKTYYISPTGNDKNTGLSPRRAWRTIHRVNLAKLRSGVTLKFQGGSTFTINTASDPNGLYFYRGHGDGVTITSYGSGRATLDAGDGLGIYFYGVGNVMIKDLIVKGSGYGTNQGNGVFFEHPNRSGVLGSVNIDGIEVSGFGDSGIYFLRDQSVTSSDIVGYRNILISNVNVHHNGYIGVANWTPDDADNFLQDFRISDSRIHDNPGVRGYNSGYGIAVGNIRDGGVYRSQIYDNGSLGGSWEEGGTVAVEIAVSSNVIIDSCEIWGQQAADGPDAEGIDLAAGCRNCIAQYNYVHDNAGAGILVDNSGFPVPNVGSVIRFNVFENNAATVQWRGEIVVAEDYTSDVTIYNNTIYSSTALAAIIIPDFLGIPQRVRIWNNVIVTKNTRYSILVERPPANPDDLQFLGNVYCNVNDSERIPIVWGNDSYSSVTSWRSGTGQETLAGGPVGAAADPQLTNPGSGDERGYLLLSTSPVRHTGLDLKTLFGIDPGSRDYFGNPLPPPGTNLFSAGAHQYT